MVFHILLNLGEDKFEFQNVGLSADSEDKAESGDLIISYSNLDTQSQSNVNRKGYSELLSSGITIDTKSGGTNYSFPICFRKRVFVRQGSPIYLALSLVRSPSDIMDSSYNNWIGNSEPHPISGYRYDLAYPLPFEYNIIYEPSATNSTSIAGSISNWQGIAGFSTNLSLSSLL